MGKIAMPSDLKLISERLWRLFKSRSQTRYWLQVVNDRYDQCFNFFFNSQRQGERLKSVPLHIFYHYDLNDLEELLWRRRQVCSKPQQSLKEITHVLTDTYNRQRIVTV